MPLTGNDIILTLCRKYISPGKEIKGHIIEPLEELKIQQKEALPFVFMPRISIRLSSHPSNFFSFSFLIALLSQQMKEFIILAVEVFSSKPLSSQLF